FPWPVVHERHSWTKAMHQRRSPRPIHTMVRRLIEIDCANGVVRADEVTLQIPGEVSQVDGAESAIRDDDSCRMIVVGERRGFPRCMAGAERIWFSGPGSSGNGTLENRGVGRHYRHVYTSKRNLVARLHDVSVASGYLRIPRHESVYVLPPRLIRGSVIVIIQNG